MESKSIFERIRAVYGDLSKQQKIVADAILDHYEETVLLNAKELSEKIGVSSATIVRFAQALHYDGYPDLAKELRQHFFEENSPMVKLRESFTGPSDRFETFRQVMELDQENIRLLDKQTTPQSLSDALELLLRSKNVVIIGGRTSFSLVHYAGFLFRQLDEKFDFFNSCSDDAIERLGSLKAKDCVFAISFHRYFKRTNDLAAYCNKKGIPVLGLTDNTQSPLLANCSLAILAPNKAPFYSYVPAMVVLNALIAAFAKALKKSAKDIFEKKTQELLDNDIYV